MNLVNLRGMPGHLIAAMVAAVEDEPRSLRLEAFADRASMPEDERPIPMKEDGAQNTTEDLQERLEDLGYSGEHNG